MHELDREPISASWMRQTIRFWNKIIARPDDDLVKVAMIESCDLARAGEQCWAAHLNRSVGTQYGCLVGELHPLPEQEIMEAFMQSWWSKHKYVTTHVQTEARCEIRDVSDRSNRGFKVLTYFHWFAPEADTPKQERWWYHVNDEECIRALAQYRLGSHWLEIERGRYTYIPRSQRVCMCCNSGDRGDEVHMIQCSFHEAARQRFAHMCLFNKDWGSASDSEIKTYMNAPARSKGMWEDMAAFVLQCKRACLERMSHDDDQQQ